MLDPFFKSLNSILRKPQAPSSRWRSHLLTQGAIRSVVTGMDRNGKGLVVWDNGGELWSAGLESCRRSALATFPLFTGRNPVLALEPGGRGMLAWVDGPTGREQLLTAPVEPGNVVPSPHALDAAGPIQHLQVAADRRGGAIVLWSQCGPRGWEIRVQTYDGRAKTWEAASTQLGKPDSVPTLPRLVMNDHGLAMAIWQTREEDFEGLVVAYNWPHDRIWSDHPIRIALCNAAELAASMDDRGTAIVCWVKRRHGKDPVLETSRFSEASCDWTTPSTLATASGLFQLRLATDPNGDALLVWRQKESSGNDHLLGRFCHKGVWGDPSLHINPGPEPIRDYAILKRADQAAVLLLPLKGGAVFHHMQEGAWQLPANLTQDSQEAAFNPTLLHHPTGLTAIWLTGSQADVRLMVAAT